MGFEEQGATHNRVEVVANQRLETPQRTSYRTNCEQKGYKGDKAKTTRPRGPLTSGSSPTPPDSASVTGGRSWGWVGAPHWGALPPPARQPS